MKNLSVTTFIHILFSVAITILIATFLLFLSWDKDRQKIDKYKRYQLISLTFLSTLEQDSKSKKLDALYKELSVKAVSPQEIPDVKKAIQSIGNTVFSGGSSLGMVRVFDIHGRYYIYIQRMAYNLMLEDMRPQTYFFEIAVALGIFLITLLLLLYLAVLKKLYPLKRLHKQIQKFAHGDMHTRISYEYDDEIGKIAKSFDEAIVYINKLSASKNLFMRNLMHELKTPITKGRIVVEMIDDESTKGILIRAFERMNELISELAELERVTEQSFEPKFEYALLSDMIKESTELLMTNSTSIHIDIQDSSLYTDKNLMSLVIKNLIDNGIKYGEDETVFIQTYYNSIEIISKGKILERQLSYYTEPFSQEEKRSAGFGLGLYIVNSTLEKLGYRLGYKHKDGYNIFMLVPRA
ncbi:Putative two-component sensor [hydrothermal vent metagenome]|uniref:histidine kinase n=1 Tax=hydrothermal vent metagenome TaxID=652676 RepID=A0A1W1D028_9ZZZZ